MHLGRLAVTRWQFIALNCVAIASIGSGCGTMKSRLATEQLLVSDAVDRSIEQLDFSPLGGSTVFLDTTYLRQVDSVGFVNAPYIISSLRERMVAAHCLLEENRQTADYVVEVRVGALGTDGHEINYGLPASGTVSSTAALLSPAAALPPLPEISFAKRDERRAAAKIGVYAYHRESKRPVWTPGMVKGESLAKSTWFLGAGPFQQGTIYESTQFAGGPISVPESPAVVAIQKMLPMSAPIERNNTDGRLPAVEDEGVGNMFVRDRSPSQPAEGIADWAATSDPQPTHRNPVGTAGASVRPASL